MLQIEIDNGSGFCFGVTTAIKKAEEELAAGEQALQEAEEIWQDGWFWTYLNIWKILNKTKLFESEKNPCPKIYV